MYKTIACTSFIIASLLVILVFVTSRTYGQLTIAAISYLPLAYAGLKIFPRKRKEIDLSPTPVVKPETLEPEKLKAESESVQVSDNDKRAFLKFLGAAGVSFLLFSVLGKRFGSIFSGDKSIAPGSTSLEDAKGEKINPAEKQPTDGYKISEIDNNIAATYYGFTNMDGAWFIMREDVENGSFRYVRGNDLFSSSWGNREKLSYDYYYNIF